SRSPSISRAESASPELGDQVGGLQAGEAGGAGIEDVAGAAAGEREVVAQQGDPCGCICGRDRRDDAVAVAAAVGGDAIGAAAVDDVGARGGVDRRELPQGRAAAAGDEVLEVVAEV